MQDQVEVSRQLVEPTPGGSCRTEFTGAPVKELGRISGIYFDLKPRILTVIAMRRLSQTLMRIRFRAHDDFADFHTLGPEDHVKLFFDQQPDGTPAMPRIIDAVLDEVMIWQNRQLDEFYPVIFLDALRVKIRDGHLAEFHGADLHCAPDSGCEPVGVLPGPHTRLPGAV